MAWTIADSRSMYGIRHWGAGYFDIGDNGQVCVHPRGKHDDASLDLYQLTRDLRARGLALPLLVRFPDILQDRVRQLTGAFDANIARLEYQSRYTALYPIKVNQQEAVIENIIATQNVSIGLEAGSKPELLAVLALAPKGGTIVCNGYKDREFIRLALMGQKLGHNVFIVIEKESEVQLVIEEAADLKVAPQVGLRVRLSSLASSKWADTGGEKSKFGLSAAEMCDAIAKLKAWGQADTLKLLHFHLGSQISHIRSLKEALKDYRPVAGKAAPPAESSAESPPAETTPAPASPAPESTGDALADELSLRLEQSGSAGTPRQAAAFETIGRQLVAEAGGNAAVNTFTLISVFSSNAFAAWLSNSSSRPDRSPRFTICTSIGGK